MYTSLTQKEVQDNVVKSFSSATSSLRIVICTIAFGMGIDCAGVNQVIYWRPPADLEATCRNLVEQDEMSSHPVLFYMPIKRILDTRQHQKK